MIPQIRNILYTTDLSKNSAYVFRYAVNSARKHDAKIHILHVFDKLTPSEEALLRSHTHLPELQKIRQELRNELVDEIKRRLKEFVERELKDDLETLNRVAAIFAVDGYPVEEILSKADELNCDAIVMGTHGKGFITHTFLGSVSEKVLHRTRKPVFIIPIPKHAIDMDIPDI